jgi:hypothetical protein
MAFAPLPQRGEDGEQVLADGGGQVLISRGMVAVSPAFDDAGFLELAQPQCEGLPWRTRVDLDVLESVDAETKLPKNEQAPALSDDLECVSDGADPGSPKISRFGFLTHGATIPLEVSRKIELSALWAEAG